MTNIKKISWELLNGKDNFLLDRKLQEEFLWKYLKYMTWDTSNLSDRDYYLEEVNDYNEFFIWKTESNKYILISEGDGIFRCIIDLNNLDFDFTLELESIEDLSREEYKKFKEEYRKYRKKEFVPSPRSKFRDY